MSSARQRAKALESSLGGKKGHHKSGLGSGSATPNSRGTGGSGRSRGGKGSPPHKGAGALDLVTVRSNSNLTTADGNPSNNPQQEEVKKELQYAESMINSFKPIKWLMMVFGRLPIDYHRTETGVTIFTKLFQNTFSFKSAYSNVFSFHGLALLFTNFLLFVMFGLALLNFLGILLNFPRQDVYTTPWKNATTGQQINKTMDVLKAENLFLIRRNIVPVIVILTSLFSVTIANVCFFKRRDLVAKTLDMWAEAVQKLKIDVGTGVWRSMTTIIIIYIGLLVLLIILVTLQFAPVATGAPGILALLLGRIFQPSIASNPNFYLIRGIMSLVFLYIVVCAKIYLLYFLFFCKLMKNAFHIWNLRLDLILNQDKSAKAESEPVSKLTTNYYNLFKDHVQLLELMEGIDTIFATIIESFFACQIICICFEIYHCYRSQIAKDEFMGQRRYDGYIMACFVVQTGFILFNVALAAAAVGEEAARGLEIVRHKGLMGKKTDEEVHFMLSMHTSFTGQDETGLMGAKYFVLDRTFIVGIVGLIFSFFIILIQFTPPLSVTPTNIKIKEYLDETAIKNLLNNVEGVQYIKDTRQKIWE